ncbi:hypothetical protein [Mycobacterium riyadhense]|uniref:hypothetical protein n=1 Tax=Mycobacterium riyadhense TaxID=486698 RepID=UPI00209527A4|nr:hypothetical protein [Mycobacterium riyadhense]
MNVIKPSNLALASRISRCIGLQRKDSPTGATGLTHCAVGAVAAVADQQPAGLANAAGGGRVGAIADQRTPQQCHSLRISHSEQVFSESLQRRCGGRLRDRVRSPRTGQVPHELVTNHCGLPGHRLVIARVLGE